MERPCKDQADFNRSDKGAFGEANNTDTLDGGFILWQRWRMTEPSLIPADQRSSLPKLYATEENSDPIVQLKFFTPWTNWTWFLTEFDGEDTCFGLVCGFETELGYFSLAELEAIRGPGELRIERDLHFTPKPLSEIRAEIERLERLSCDDFEP